MARQKWRYVGVMGAAAMLLSGCAFVPGLSKQEKAIVADMQSSKYQPASREMRNNVETQDNFAQAAFWSQEYQLNPADLEAAIKLSAAVRKMGNPGKAVEIAQTSRAMYPRDPYLTAEYAAALIAAERGGEAMEALDGGLRIAPGYARLWSLKGAALDQQENYDLARKHYSRALQITPQDPNVMSNLGLSYALAGDAATAETWMRRAAQQPGAGANIQQNLNLIMQLQGKSASAAPAMQSKARAQGQPQALRAAPPAAALKVYAPSRSSAQPRTYGQAVSSAAPTPRSTPSYTGSQPSYGQSAYAQKSAAQSAGGFGYRSNTTIVGQQGQARSASDMARAAAAKSRGQGQKVVVPMGQEPKAVPADILAILSQNVGPRQSQQSAQVQRAPQPQYQPQPQAAQYGYPAQRGYPQPAQASQYPSPDMRRRGAARRR